MNPQNAFAESAASYGIGVAVLLAVVVGLLFILWKLGTRLTSAHETYLAKTAAAAEVAAEATQQIKVALPTVCQYSGECDNFKPRKK